MRDFHDDNHANNRLSRCYLAYLSDGKWRVTRISGATKTKIVTSCGREFDIKSKDIKILFPELGYVNAGRQCAYLTRSSRRMWKVGLTTDNLIIEFLFRNYVGMLEDIGVGNMLAKTLNDEYPSIKKALDDVSNKRLSGCAFSRKFCFGLHNKTKETVLYYKNKSVGYYDKRLKGLVIFDTNSHIIQQVIEAMKGEDIKVII